MKVGTHTPIEELTEKVKNAGLSIPHLSNKVHSVSVSYCSYLLSYLYS